MRITESQLRRIISETLESESPFIQFLRRADPGLVQRAEDETRGLTDDELTAELRAAEEAEHDWRESGRDERRARGLTRDTARLDTLRTAAALRGLPPAGAAVRIAETWLRPGSCGARRPRAHLAGTIGHAPYSYRQHRPGVSEGLTVTGNTMRKIPLQFSDIDFGTEEFGFIPVEPGEDPDDADARYLKHLAAQGVRGSIDRMGNLVVEGSGRRGTLRLTEGQLRRIIRQEVRRLTESHTPESVAQEALDLYDTAPKGVGYPGESAFRLINQRSREGVDREASLAAIAAMDPEAAKDIKNAMRMSSHLDTMGVYPAGRYGGD